MKVTSRGKMMQIINTTRTGMIKGKHAATTLFNGNLLTFASTNNTMPKGGVS
jgi:allantoicase